MSSAIRYGHIAIEGNIGAGKTTIANKISAILNARLVLERFENNPFLPQFYANRDRYALQVELFFLADRYKQLSGEMLGDIFHPYTVYDYHFAKSAIFSSLNLANHELDLFRSLYAVMDRFVPKPEVLIYIHHDIKQLHQQINKRGRKMEVDIPHPYLEEVHVNYMKHFKEETKYPIVVIDFRFENDKSVSAVANKVMTALTKEWPLGLNILA